MKRVFSGNTLHDTVHLQNLLSLAGIRCIVRNRDLGGGLGDLPFLDCSPELWVLADEEAERADALIRDALRPSASPHVDSWRCVHCGEENEAQFAACWRCGRGDQG
jgi:Putative prokaryotic signal transducing protein